MKKGFIYYLAKLSQYKSVYAWIVFIVLSIITLVDINSAYFRVSVIVFLFTILLTILDTHKRIALVFRTRYEGIHDAWFDIENELTKVLKKKNTSIYWQGITLGDAWPQLLKIIDPLIKNGTLTNFTLHLTQIEPSFLDKITGQESGLSGRSESTNKLINSYKRMHNDVLQNNNIDISVHRYSYMPNFHGLLINSKLLFLSYVRWEKDWLYVAEEPYEKYLENSDNGTYKIALFKSWLEKAMKDDSGGLLKNTNKK